MTTPAPAPSNPPEPLRAAGAFKAQITKRVWYPDAPETVWVALTDPAALAEWLMPNDFKPVVGHRFRFSCDPCPGPVGQTTQCEVLELEAPRRMLWSWHMQMKPGYRESRPLLVEWTLEPERGGTRLTLRQSAYDGPRSLMIRLMMSVGWGLMIKRLMPRVMKNIAGARFTPGAIPREKRGYSTKKSPPGALEGLTY